MTSSQARTTVALISTTVSSVLLAFQQHDLSLAAVADPTVRAEVAQLGPYPEMSGIDTVVAMNWLPERSTSAYHAELYAANVRVRIEAQPFEATMPVKRTRDGYRLEHRPIIGWEDAPYHTRMSRLEVVTDGMVCTVPVAAFSDVFDIARNSEGNLWVQVACSTDGYRTYVLAQAGEGREAKVITWVFDDGQYRGRVVDPIE